MKDEARGWMEQAEADLKSAEKNLRFEVFYVASNLCQQAAEKALKAVLLWNGERVKKTHDLVNLGKIVGLPSPLIVLCDRLNPVQVESRYPDAGPVLPYKKYTATDATADIAAAREILVWARKKLL